MKSILLAGVAFAFTTSAALAFGDHEKKTEWTDEMKEWKAACKEAKDEDSKTDCKCLTKKAFKDEAVKADLDAYESMDTVGEAGKAAIMACQMHDDHEKGDH